MSLFDLTGRTALVTGASRGIGRALALGLADAGADVALLARDADALDAVAAEVRSRGRQAVVVPADVTARDAVQQAVEGAIAALDHLDIVVNNAGGNSVMVPFADLRFGGWEKAMRLNLDSVVHVSQAVAPHLLQRRSGSVINVASVAALQATPTLAPYGASKAAVLSLTKSLAAEWAWAGVRVNALCPGWTQTDLNRVMWENEQASAALMARVPMGRWAQPEEMVGPVVFLASDASSYLTGQALAVDGGQSAT